MHADVMKPGHQAFLAKLVFRCNMQCLHCSLYMSLCNTLAQAPLVRCAEGSSQWLLRAA